MSPVMWTLLFGQGCVKLCCGAPGAAGTLKKRLTKNQQPKPRMLPTAAEAYTAASSKTSCRCNQRNQP